MYMHYIDYGNMCLANENAVVLFIDRHKFIPVYITNGNPNTTQKSVHEIRT